MGLIRYKITSGVIPVVAEILGTTIPHNTHYGPWPEEGQFYVNTGSYTIKFTDGDGCTDSQTFSDCGICPENYTPVGNKCEKWETRDADIRLPVQQITEKEYFSYTNFGTLIFDDWNYDGTGTYEKINITNSYWINPYINSSSLGGPMNRSAVWSNLTYNEQDVGFSICIDLLVPKIYYVGVGCDNFAKIKLNGEYILEQDVQKLIDMLGGDTQVTFKYWFIYPIYLQAGRNILEIFGHNEYSVAAVGVEIYNASKETLKTITSDVELGEALIFRAKDHLGEDLNYTYSEIDGLRGYYCEDDEALDMCPTTPQCIKKSVIECGQTLAETEEIEVTFVPDCNNLTFPFIADGTLTKSYILNNYFSPSRDISEFINIEITSIFLADNSSFTYNGEQIEVGDIITFSETNNIYVNVSNNLENLNKSYIKFIINLNSEAYPTQNLKFTFINQGCEGEELPMAMYVSIDEVFNGDYNYAIEEEIPYSQNVLIPFSNPTTGVAEYHFMFISIPVGLTFTVLDPLGNDISSSFVYKSDDVREGYMPNKLYRYNEPFGSSLPVNFKILVD